MPRLFDQMKVPENIVEASADKSNAKHIYRNYLKGRMVEQWMDMCDDARNEIPPQQFFFRYLMRDNTPGLERHPNDKLSPDPLGFGMTGTNQKITKNWTLNVSGAFFEEVGEVVLANDWSPATWRDIYERCEWEAVSFEDSNGFFTDFVKTPHYPKFIEAKLLSIYDRNKAGVLMEVGLNMRHHAAIINHQFFPLAMKYTMVSAYLIEKNHAQGRGMKQFAKSYFDTVGQRNTMPMTYDEFFDRVSNY